MWIYPHNATSLTYTGNNSFFTCWIIFQKSFTCFHAVFLKNSFFVQALLIFSLFSSLILWIM